ncbi:MAG: hypothetical protein MSA09_05950 [Lachnospiraceae bacterium]|nr:hypothetical protein [Lachnospiraceae bacterium]
MRAKFKKIVNKVFCTYLAMMAFMMTSYVKVYAGTDFKTTKLYTGSIALAQNLTAAIVGASEVIGGLVLVALYLKQLGSEENEIPQIKKMRRTTIYIMVIIGLVGSLLAAVLSYYK